MQNWQKIIQKISKSAVLDWIGLDLLSGTSKGLGVGSWSWEK